MNSRERVQAAIAREPVDVVPLGFFIVDYDTVEKVIGHPTYVRNKIDTRFTLWEGRRDEVAQSLKEDMVEFHRRIDCADLIVPKEGPILPPKDYEPSPPKKIADDKWEDGEGRIYQVSRLANEILCIHDPAVGTHEYTVDDFAEPVAVDPPDPSEFEVWDYVYDQLGQERYVASPTGGITALTLLDGFEMGLMMHLTQPDVVMAANRQSVAKQNQLDQYYVRKGAPGAYMEQDIAGSNGPLISPKMFREFCLPFLKERVQHVKRSTSQVIFHNCGNNIPLMSMFIECGIDCYQSLQTTAGMEVGRLKEQFGDHLCFWGGVPTELLIDGTPQEVRQAVRTAMDRGAPGGGFILGPSHSIAANTKYENFMAFLDEFVSLRDKY